MLGLPAHFLPHLHATGAPCRPIDTQVVVWGESSQGATVSFSMAQRLQACDNVALAKCVGPLSPNIERSKSCCFLS